MNRIAVTALAALTLGSAAGAAAETWPDPDRSVTMVVPFAAGGGTDVIFRAFADALGAELGTPVAVENIGGAGSATGTTEVITREADGYTVLASGTHTIGATMQGLTEGYLRLEHVASLNWDPFMVAVLADSPYDSFDDVVEAARAAPGTLCLGNAGMGGATGVASIGIHLAFDSAFNVIPFDGGQELRAEVLAGRCAVGIFGQSEVLDYQQLKPLVILYDTRSVLDGLAHVPTMSEIGYADLPVTGGSFRSISVKEGTPEIARERLAEAAAAAFDNPAFQTFMTEHGLISAFNSLDETDAYFEELIAAYVPLLREAGLYALD
jgi:tripartite-type tricarboxylate transporter receptor subunit TctC